MNPSKITKSLFSTLLIFCALCNTACGEISGTSASNTYYTYTPATTTPTTEAVDPRVPNYTGTTTDYQEIKLTWTTETGGSAWISFNADANVYAYYKTLSRYYDDEDYVDKYIRDAYSQQLFTSMTEGLRACQESGGWDDYRLVQETINMVQQCIVYQKDDEGTGHAEYPKYPIETVFEQRGDCEDSAMLLAGLIHKLGFACAILGFKGHVGVGVSGNDTVTGDYFAYDGKNYFYVESTEGGDIGELPSELEGQTALVYPL